MKNIQEFAARKHNKYSIRKFSVGIASILVGSIFFYNNNAQASENQPVQEGSQVTESSANDAQGQSQQQNDMVDATNQANTNANEGAQVSERNTTADNVSNSVQRPNAQATSSSSQPQVVQAPAVNSADNNQGQNVSEAPKVLQQAQVPPKEIAANTKKVDVLKYVEENKQYLTENERQFFLRAVSREVQFPDKDWQNIYKGNYDSIGADVNQREVGNQKVNGVKTVVDAVQRLIADRDKDSYYTDLRQDNTARRTNSFTVSNDIVKDNEGRQSIKLGLRKEFVPISYPQGGKWHPWSHRFEHWGLRTSESLSKKIEEVRVQYKWNKKAYDQVMTRDKDGFYWHKDDEANGYKPHYGGGVDFLVKLKKGVILNKDEDKAWGHIISDARHFHPMAVVNYEFKKFNFENQNFDKNFNASSLATLKDALNNKISDAQRGFADADANKTYYSGLVTAAVTNVQTAEQYVNAKAKLANIDKRVSYALQEVRPTTVQNRQTVNANTKDVDVLKYVEANSNYLSDEERKFFLRQVTRHSGFHDRDWNNIYNKNYDSISTNVNTRTVGESNVAELNKLLTAMYELIESRNNDQHYKELTNDQASQNLNNSFTLDNNVTQNNGQQTIKVTVSKATLQFSDYQNGDWWNWSKRYEQWGLRTNEALNRKIDKVVAKYRWNGQDREDVLVRDSKGFYWFKEDEKFENGKAKIGGGVDFHITFKKDVVLDKEHDKLWGYVISDSKELETKAGANIGFGKVDFTPVLTAVNTQTLTNLKQDLLNNIQTLTPVLTANEQNAETFKTKAEAVTTDNLNEQQYEQVKAQLAAITQEVAQAALKNNLVTVPTNKEHLSQYAKLSSDNYFLSFQSLNTDPTNSLNADGSVTLKPNGYLFYNVKAENALAPGKQINLTVLANKVDSNAKFEYAVQGENNNYIVGVTQIPKIGEGQYKLQNFTIPQGAKKFALRLDNRTGTTDTHVNLFTLVPEDNQKNKAENLLVIPDNFQHIGNYAKYMKDGQFLSFQTLNTQPINSFNPDGSVTLKPKGYLFYNLKAEGELAPGKQFNVLVMTSQVDPKTKFEYGFHDQSNKLGNTITAITKTNEGTFTIENVTVPENVKDVALRLDNRTGTTDTIIQGVFVLPKKVTEA